MARKLYSKRTLYQDIDRMLGKLEKESFREATRVSETGEKLRRELIGIKRMAERGEISQQKITGTIKRIEKMKVNDYLEHYDVEKDKFLKGRYVGGKMTKMSRITYDNKGNEIFVDKGKRGYRTTNFRPVGDLIDEAKRADYDRYNDKVIKAYIYGVYNIEAIRDDYDGTTRFMDKDTGEYISRSKADRIIAKGAREHRRRKKEQEELDKRIAEWEREHRYDPTLHYHETYDDEDEEDYDDSSSTPSIDWYDSDDYDNGYDDEEEFRNFLIEEAKLYRDEVISYFSDTTKPFSDVMQKVINEFLYDMTDDELMTLGKNLEEYGIDAVPEKYDDYKDVLDMFSHYERDLRDLYDEDYMYEHRNF